MFAGRRVAPSLLAELFDQAVGLLAALLGWVLLAPLAALVPRRKDWVAVIGRDEGKFVDNAKYFLLQATPALRPNVRCVFVTERRDVADMLLDSDYEVMLYPRWRSVCFLLRAGTLIADSTEWHMRLRRFLTVRCRHVQLWHGVGYKRIELGQWRNEAVGRGWRSWPVLRAVRSAKRVFVGRVVRYDLVNTTSAFYRDEVFKPAFRSSHFTALGYPRNTFGELNEAAKAMAWRNVDSGITRNLRAWLADGRRMVLVAPTFRDTRASPMGLTAATLTLLDSWCEQQRVELVFKFHPAERQASAVEGRHLHLCSPESDLYPLMPISSALITDYSSIYMDYLLLDKPILFLVPDLDEYVSKDRQLQFDFREMTPGPKAATWDELVKHATQQWERDDYAQARDALKLKAFGGRPQELAAPLLIEFMRQQGWLPSESTASVSPVTQADA